MWVVQPKEAFDISQITDFYLISTLHIVVVRAAQPSAALFFLSAIIKMKWRNQIEGQKTCKIGEFSKLCYSLSFVSDPIY